MKKLITTALIAATITGSAFAVNFTDVPKDAWYAADLNAVLTDDRYLITGYPDGTFKPDMGFSVEQFAVIMVKASGVSNMPTETGDWAAPWVKKAMELGYIKQGEFNSTSRPITRGEMARIIIRYTETREKNTYGDAAALQKSITDYAKVRSELKSDVVKVYDLGIIGGYPDGTFGADKSLKRSEAVAVVNKIISPAKRLGAKVDFSLFNKVPTEEAIDLKKLNDYDKSLFRGMTCYTGTLEQLNSDLKFAGYHGTHFGFDYNIRTGVAPMFVVDNKGDYHICIIMGKSGHASFGMDNADGHLEGRTLVKMIFIKSSTNEIVIVPCNYKLVQ